jgi:hypothetical protein
MLDKLAIPSQHDHDMTPSSFAETASRLARFAERRAAIGAHSAGISERLGAFLEAAGPMLRYRPRPRTLVVADRTGFANAMTAIAEPLRLARDAGILADPWAMAGLKRREVANAAVLAGLWSTASGGKIATEFLSAFLERLRSRPGGAKLPDHVALGSGYLVRTEDRPTGEADRIDITIEGQSFLVGIEVKIDAGLQPDQLGRYQAAIGRRAAGGGKVATVIFLSLRHTEYPDVLNARWDDVAAAARAVASKGAMARDINRHLIERFAAHVARF